MKAPCSTQRAHSLVDLAHKQSGQIAVIVLLIMVVVLTVGLSLASRTVQDVQVTTENTESTRVFNAAESAVEEALAEFKAAQALDPNNPQFNTPGTVVNLDFAAPGEIGEQFDASATDVRATVQARNDLETYVPVGTTATINLVGSSGTVRVYWARESGCSDQASVLLTIYSKNASDKVTSRYVAYAPYSCDRSDDFEASGIGTNGYSSLASLGISALGEDHLLTIMPLYKDTHVRVEGVTAIQSHVFQGTADNVRGPESRTIELVRGIPSAPSIMGYAVYSAGSIEK